MGADGAIELTWAGDLRTFRLGIAELLALQEKRNAGPLEIVTRLQGGTWFVQDLVETIRLGLIGAGEDGKKAQLLIEENVRSGHIVEHTLVALAILFAALQGVPDDPVGKVKAVAGAPETIVSAPPPSTETVQ